MKKSVLQQVRASYLPKMPRVFEGNVEVVEGNATESVADCDEIRRLFPNTYGLPEITFVPSESTDRTPGDAVNVGVILSGGQAPGGHNVIAGIYDGIKAINPDSRLFGFLMGPGGFVDHQFIELTGHIVDEYRNTGGFDIIGSGRTKLETKEQFDKGLEILKELDITALVIIGGDDSNTNAAVLAEYYKQINAGVSVIGCPKTIDGDLKNCQIETSFGFDTATKVYSELIGNIQRDCNSSRKYWHFIRLMGRSASHITLECALQTQPNVCLISEEVEAKNMTLRDIAVYIAEIVAARAEKGMNYGTVLVPEGLIEFIPAFKALIAEINEVLAGDPSFNQMLLDDQKQYLIEQLSDKGAEALSILPDRVARQLMLERDPHGNVQVSLIETGKLLSEMVRRQLVKMKAQGRYKGKFASQHHFFGYEGRCSDPSNFDADYCYALGRNAAQLISAGKTGYMSSVRNLTAPASEWIAGGIPITMMMNMERRSGGLKPVIQKALVDLNGSPFRHFASERTDWALNTRYMYPGPIQFFGPREVCDRTTLTLYYEKTPG